ncbi:creatininase family protein [Pelagibacterium lentulum]|uniref:Creatininase n=1 Tax=Pelagibacterium lentulum TaxID=2029865 RepID=A0A916W106_9HYPH|nr:creatininase family protein [Pelagibacterium lentulum]GGA58947.1 creatininase [Pelagibacterium lentulum]
MALSRLPSIDALAGHCLTDKTIGILPVGATEAHGPHLPVSTDCDIAEGHLTALAGHLPPKIDALVLPIQRIGASLEHAHLAGTHSADFASLLAEWFAIAKAFRESGGRKLVIVSSHGGNSAVVDSLILRARAELDMLAVGTGWLRFGYPEGLFDENERRYGIHGGDIETSLMLHYWPEKVDMARAENFVSRLERLEPQMAHLTAYGRHRFGWLSTDLHPAGVVGNAAAASAAKGAAAASHILGGFVDLLEDIDRFDLEWLGEQKA